MARHPSLYPPTLSWREFSSDAPELELSVRARNCCRRGFQHSWAKDLGFKRPPTLGELDRLTDHEILQVKDLGRKSLREIRQLIWEFKSKEFLDKQVAADNLAAKAYDEGRAYDDVIGTENEVRDRDGEIVGTLTVAEDLPEGMTIDSDTGQVRPIAATGLMDSLTNALARDDVKRQLALALRLLADALET